MLYLPINVDLTDQPCLIVGGGGIALRKAKTLLAAGADKKVEIMGRSLVEAAQELGHQQVVALLGG